jgi:hypothetical protein
LVHISKLMQEIYALKQDSHFLTQYYSELKILWDELELYKSIPSCSCRVKCLCDAMRSARQNHTLLYASVKYVAEGSWIIYSRANYHTRGSLNHTFFVPYICHHWITFKSDFLWFFFPVIKE